VLGLLPHLNDPTDLSERLALTYQLVGGYEFTNDFLVRMPGALHGPILG